MHSGERLRIARENLNVRLQDGLYTAGIKRRRFGEWLRRRAFDTVNGGLGLGVIFLGYMFLATVINDPHLASIPKDTFPLLSNLLHLPFNNFSETTQQAGQIAQAALNATVQDMRAAGIDTLDSAALWGVSDGTLASMRQYLNAQERERRCVDSHVIPLATLIPDPRRQPQPNPPSTQPPLILQPPTMGPVA